jgi:flagellum-specific peptidoglycan hydrolase FlgJ
LLTQSLTSIKFSKKIAFRINHVLLKKINGIMRISLVLVFFFISVFAQAQNAAFNYINKFDSLAIEVLCKYEIPASLVLGIALQESAAGTSKLCRVSHNHFGVKGRVRSSKTESGYTTSYRKFDTDEDAYLHFGEMISRKKYYSVLKGDMDYMSWLKAMKKAGYAASSQWITHVDSMIKRYGLTRFDTPFSYPFPDPLILHPANTIEIQD